MIRKDKDLLLRDLSARLPYKVIVDYSYNAFDVHNGNYVKHGSKCILNCYLLDIFMSPRQNEIGEYIKPYLRPMSSMTVEEKKEYYKTFRAESYGRGYVYVESVKSYDWLNAHHFDFRGLIEKGLAIEVTEENNPYLK